jgi:hypothetical protein
VAVLGLGDMQYENSDYTKYLQSYDLSWGAFKAKTWPSPGGGHDVNGGGGYYQYFGSQAGPSQNQTWYSLNIGNWHIVSLNANCGNVPGYVGISQCKAGSAQETWLVSDLRANTRPCQIMYVHYPRWNAGQFADNTNYNTLLNDFYSYGGDLLLTGHDHDYQRYAPMNPNTDAAEPTGVREFVVGTGGDVHNNNSNYPLNTGKANLEVSNGNTYGVLKLTLHSSSYDWQFVPDNGSPGSFTDAGSGSCH